MRKRRVMAKAKVYGFSPWVDQVDAINQIMKETGEKTESVVLRKLLDEALEARRHKKTLSLPNTEGSHESGDRLNTIETLLMRLVRQGEISLSMEDVSLALLQDVLAEAHDARRISWESLVAPKLLDEGVDATELEQQFIMRTNTARDYAYDVAVQLKTSENPI
jgi:hypothetical protein